MNVKNNKRRRESVEKIEKAFVELLQERELMEITVTDICAMTGLNRSTFYANFADVYELADRFREKLEQDFSQQFRMDDEHREQDGALRMFRHIRENQLFYSTYFKLGYDRQNQILVYDTVRAEQDFDGRFVPYHIEFFRSGLNAIIQLWLKGGCKETPEEMAEILRAEYRGR